MDKDLELPKFPAAIDVNSWGYYYLGPILPSGEVGTLTIVLTR